MATKINKSLQDLAEIGFLSNIKEELKEKALASAVEEYKEKVGPIIDAELDKIINIRAEKFRNLYELKDELHVFIHKDEE